MSIRQAAFVGWVWATVAGLLGMRFIVAVVERFTDLGWAGGIAALGLLAVGQALPWAGGAAVFRLLQNRLGITSSLSFAVGVLVSLFPTLVIAWTPAGLLTPWPALVQLADLIGERGVSFLLAAAAALLSAPVEALLIRGRGGRAAAWSAAAGAGLIGLLATYGAVRMHFVNAELSAAKRVQIGIVQPATAAKLRWEPAARRQMLQHLRQMTMRAEAAGSELTLWPEAAYPYVIEHAAARVAGAGGIVGTGVRGPVLFGTLSRSRSERGRHNAATIIDAYGRTQLPQAKLALLWFGETIPFADQVPVLRRAFFRAGSLVPGDQVVLLEHDRARIGVLNCYEDTLPAVGRRLARAGPNLLVNLTNDAWFSGTSAPELHLRLAAMRAIEARRDLIRAVNLGPPAWIDATGVVRRRGDSERAGVMRVSPALNDASPTLYTRAGDMPLLLALFVVAGNATWRSRRRRLVQPQLTGPNP